MSNLPAPSVSTPAIGTAQRRGSWLRVLHQWHWISAAVSLVGMLVFSITGITLNHASRIEAIPHITHRTATMPPTVMRALASRTHDRAPLPEPAARWLEAQLEIPVGTREAEWSNEEIYLSMPGPGHDTWISIQRADGAVEYERTQRGWIAYFNDLHKGRNTGPAWAWFIDVFALACIVFTISGLCLLAMHARQRRMTWSWVGLGVLIPLLLALLLIH